MDSLAQLNGIKLFPKILKSRENISQFVDTYHEKGGVQTSIEYLEKCNIVKVFEDNNGKWQASYCVNSNPTMRYLEPFDETLKRRILKDKNLQEDQMVEISQIWINRKVLVYEDLRSEIYFSSIKDALKTEMPILIGGSKVASVWKSYETIIERELYFGLVPFKSGLSLGKIVYGTTLEVAIAMKRFTSY